jgi:hypothetical protein
MARIELDEIMQGLGMLGGVLSLPRQVEGQQIENEQQKALLKEAGYDEATIAKMAPQPRMRWLSAGQPGFGGKVLGGVGDVGSILTTIVGKPIKAPRMEMSDLAAMSTMRAKNAQALAQKRLGEVVMDPKSTNRDIAAASIAAGNTDAALRLMRPDSGGRPPASILGLRSAIESMSDDDPRKPAYKRALADQVEYERQRREEEDRMIRERQPKQYDPAESYRMRHEEEMKQRDAEARKRGYTEGSPEYKYYMSYGHDRPERAPKAEKTLDEYIDDENRRRTALAKDPRTRKEIPDEPVETTARRNMQNAQKAAAEQKSGAPVPPEAPPKPKPKGLPGAAGGAAIGGMFGGETPTTSTPLSTTTSTTQPPNAVANPDEILARFTMEDQPPEIQAQIQEAVTAGMKGWPLANWLISLQPSILKPGP